MYFSSMPQDPTMHFPKIPTPRLALIIEYPGEGTPAEGKGVRQLLLSVLLEALK